MGVKTLWFPGGVRVTPVIGELPSPGDGAGDAPQPFTVGPGRAAATLTLEDFNPPTGKAFYRVEVSVP